MFCIKNVNLVSYYKENNWVRVFILLLIFAVLSFFSIYAKYLHNGSHYLGDDILFHRMRIEGLYQGILNSDYLPKINYSLLDGLGYTSGTFYSDIFLYPSAILRLLGLSLSKAYLCLLILINFSTFCTSYYSMNTLKYTNRQSFLFSILYTLSTYRFITEVTRSALGETIAFIFIPLAFSGLISIFYKDSKKWYLLAIGMSGILLSNLLTAVTFSCLIILLMLFNLKPLFKQKEKVLSLIKAVLLTIGVVAFYLLPMLEQLSFQELYVGNYSLFNVSDTQYNVLYFLVYSVNNTPMFANIGAAYLFLIIITFLQYFKLKDRETKQLLWASILFLILTTSIIPWDILKNTPANIIQFPWRFFNVATVITCWFVSKDSLNFFKSRSGYSILIGVIVLLNIQLQTTQLYDIEANSISNENTLTTWKIGWGQEYLPISADVEDLKELTKKEEFPLYNKENGELTNYKKDYNELRFTYNLKEETEITLPFLYYKGYVFEDNLTKNEFLPSLSSENNGLLSVKLDGQGEVTLKYKGTVVHVLSNVITLLTILGSFIVIIMKKFQKTIK